MGIRTDVFLDAHAWLLLQDERGRPGRRVVVRIGEGDRPFDCVGVGQRIAFLHLQFFTMRQPGVVEPRFVVQPDGVDDERGPLETGDGVSEIVGVRILREAGGPIDDAERVLRLVYAVNATRDLPNEEGVGCL